MRKKSPAKRNISGSFTGAFRLFCGANAAAVSGSAEKGNSFSAAYFSAAESGLPVTEKPDIFPYSLYPSECIPIFSTESGMQISPAELHPQKARSPMFFRFPLRDMPESEPHPAKQNFCISVTFCGSIMLFSEEQPRKHDSGRTAKFSERVTSLSAEHPSKHSDFGGTVRNDDFFNGSAFEKTVMPHFFETFRQRYFFQRCAFVKGIVTDFSDRSTF